MLSAAPFPMFRHRKRPTAPLQRAAHREAHHRLTCAYTLPAPFDSSARVEDAVDAAGGFMRKADKASLNLARVLVDGEQIDVPAKGGTASASISSAYSSSAATASARSGAAASASTEKVNINQATAEELKTLDGVGDATAQKIIDYRTANGPFQSIEDIKNVSGIAEKRFEAIADRICV